MLLLVHFHFDLGALTAGAIATSPKHAAIFASAGVPKDPISWFSLALGLILGAAGLPHILMRYFTVPDARAARMSTFYTTALCGTFFITLMVIGYGTIAVVLSDPAYKTAAGGLRGGANMAAIHLAHAVGGAPVMGFISAVAFATILAVTSGLALSGARRSRTTSTGACSRTSTSARR